MAGIYADFLLTEHEVLQWLGPNGNGANIPALQVARRHEIQQLVASGNVSHNLNK